MALPSLKHVIALTLLAGAFSACGSESIDLDSGDQQNARIQRGAELFNDRCSGCHTLSAASAHGSKPEGQVSGGERTNGPNFDTRKVQRDDVLFAIRNGGFSGAVMPANIVVGDDAEKVADFLDEYSGKDAPSK